MTSTHTVQSRYHGNSIILQTSQIYCLISPVVCGRYDLADSLSAIAGALPLGRPYVLEVHPMTRPARRILRLTRFCLMSRSRKRPLRAYRL